MNNAYYRLSLNFDQFLNQDGDAFEDQQLIISQIVELKIIENIKKNAVNTGNVVHIDNIITNKTSLMVTVTKETRLKRGSDIRTPNCGLLTHSWLNHHLC